MASSSINLLINSLLIIFALTITRSIIVMIGGKNIFKKANKNTNSAFYPILNLFTVLDICDMSTFFGILFFIPVINLIALSIMFWKLGKVFNVSTGYKMGLVCLPMCFYPLLAFSDKQYKVTDEEYFKALDDARGESINLMTNEEISAQNLATIEEKNVDSIFKSEIDMMDPVVPYKAGTVDILNMNEVPKNYVAEEDYLKPIEAVELPTLTSDGEKQNELPKTKFTTELEKKEEVEIVDL